MIFEKAHQSKILFRQTVADLKCDREGTKENVKDRGECPKTAHKTELELSGYGRTECLSVPAADKTILNQALGQCLQDFEAIN